MDRANAYERAFAQYLLEHQVPFVAVNEGRRCYQQAERLKSPDFIVHGSAGAGWLIDVKGRRYPAGPPDRPRRVWESWSTGDDVRGLAAWAGRFGNGYQGLFVFMYLLTSDEVLPPSDDELWTWQGQRYVLRGIPVEEYCRNMHRRSPRWDTVFLPAAAYRKAIRPVRDFLSPAFLLDNPLEEGLLVSEYAALWAGEPGEN